MTDAHSRSKLSSVLLLVRRLVLGSLFILATLAAAPAAQAQDTGTYRSAPLDWGVAAGTAWVDVNADKKADFCRLGSDTGLRCTLATGRGFDATVQAGPRDPGYLETRLWGDVDGNGAADYCRRVGLLTNQRFECTFSQGSSFSFVNALDRLEWGDVEGTQLADATGDGRADYCRVALLRVICSAWTATGFGAGFTAVVDPGAEAGRAWVDYNADGKADFCRVAGPALLCTVSTGSGFGATYGSLTDDPGYDTGRTWTDVNGDSRADFCRRVGLRTDARVRCTLATATGFGAELTSGTVDWGADEGAAWVDFDGDGDRDFCRPTGTTAANARVACTLSTPTGFGVTIASDPLDVGDTTGRDWVDHNGDGKADYCRRVGSGADRRVACTTSLGTGFGPVPEPAPPVVTPPAVAPEPAPEPAAPTTAPQKLRLVVKVSYGAKVRGRWTRLTRLQVKEIPAGATVKATCKRGCSRSSFTFAKKKWGSVSLERLTAKRLRAGTTIRIVVSRPGSLSAIHKLTIRAGKRPAVKHT